MFLTRLLRDQRGVSAVEFAMIAPIMVLLYLGLAALTLVMMAERRAGHAASIVGDLVAQSTSVNAATLTDIIQIGTAIVDPGAPSDLSIRITNVQADAGGVARVVWSVSVGTALPKLAPKNSVVAGFPVGLIAANESIVKTDLRFDYDSFISQILPNVVRFNETYYHRPRRTEVIACADCT
ncbi:MAG: pilus assembly protein [Phenylobacterium sp.]|uniref:TadE/TadG family type IV pilus assembly protein n=1 Tax=Phenylobacterium sp. TaxID=1871053 RepID=UPI00273377F8|nr:TadE/TadG family type IV pilus assembly protein [Phenylobacterium sp.]MDP3175279.1 pilus assembly protein [Phenylobacterium sp.]